MSSVSFPLLCAAAPCCGLQLTGQIRSCVLLPRTMHKEDKLSCYIPVDRWMRCHWRVLMSSFGHACQKPPCCVEIHGSAPPSTLLKGMQYCATSFCDRIALGIQTHRLELLRKNNKEHCNHVENLHYLSCCTERTREAFSPSSGLGSDSRTPMLAKTVGILDAGLQAPYPKKRLLQFKHSPNRQNGHEHGSRASKHPPPPKKV